MAGKIDAWSDAAITDYEHVFKEFGLKPFPKKLSEELDHRFFRRGIVIAHRDFEKIADCMEKKKPFINITGVASSGNLHFGHKTDIDLFYFFKKHGARNYFCVCDIDGYVSREKISSLKQAKELAVANCADALALGLQEKDIAVQSRRSQRYYEFAFELSKKITANTFEATYGHIDLGKVSANLLQYADILHGQLEEFDGPMPSITGIGLDQDPHARISRDIAARLPYGMQAPSFIYFQHQSGLQEGKKMSSSAPETAIFLNDSLQDARKKISNAFTGGRPTVEEQKKLGGKPEICKVHEILRFHLPDEKTFRKMWDDCKAGTLLCGECKKFTADFICGFLKEHQQNAAENKRLAQKIVLGK